MVEEEILITGEWDAAKVLVDCSGQFQPHEKLAQHIAQVWQEKLNVHPHIFNGPLLRMKSWSGDTQNLSLFTEQTDFASYLATREPSFTEVFAEEDRANPIGMNMVVVTSDRKVVVTQRSLKSEHNPGTLNFIGGYIDPLYQKNDQINIDHQVKKELSEELNIQPEQIQKVIVQALGCDPFILHYELFVVVYTSLNSHEIEQLWQTAVDAHEANTVILVDEKELVRQNNDQDFQFPTCWSFREGLKLFAQKVAA